MIFVRLLRLLAGWVTFRVWGGFPERFLNLCSRAHIPLWNLSNENGALSAATTVAGYRRLRSCAVRSGMRSRVTARHGLPFFAHRYRRRVGLVCGFGVFLGLIGVASCAIWTINVTGCAAVDREEVLAVLEEAGLRVGCLRSRVDAPQVRFYALSRLPDVTYLTVNILGSTVEVAVTERVKQPPIPPEDVPCHVVSAVDGQLAALEAYGGTKLHSAGEAVRAGEVLIGGFAEMANGSVRFCHAKGYAVLRTQLSITSDDRDAQTILTPVREKTFYAVRFFGWRFTQPGKRPDGVRLVRRHALTARGIELPLGYSEYIYRTFAEKKQPTDQNRRLLGQTECYFLQKIEALSGAKICEQNPVRTESGIRNTVLAEISAGVAEEVLTE